MANNVLTKFRCS